MNWKFGAALLLMTILVIFVAQNYEVVEMKFLFWSVKASRAVILFLTLLTGLMAGWILAGLTHKKSIGGRGLKRSDGKVINEI